MWIAAGQAWDGSERPRWRRSAARSRVPAAVTAAILRRAEPFAETMYLVMMADGDAGEEEQRALAGALQVLRIDRIEARAQPSPVGQVSPTR